MSVRRALVDCAVLSLQDACVFYPSCKFCCSKIDAGQQDTSRCRCSRCGYSCLREQVDYRYRLSLRVARDGCIFGVTVFGACLNSFFGIHASGLQRLVQDSDGPVGASTRSTLLRKAVEDCFIGRHFIFGIKVTEAESGPWLGGSAANGSSSKDTPHFIATQMILPISSGLGGCTVVSYYRALLQRAAEYELGSTDPTKTSRPPATTLLLLPCHSPASSFNNGTLCTSGLLSQSLQRSQNQDCSLTPTPPWQQSLGLVTSSAEQEEGCSTQDSGDENRRQKENFRTPRNSQRGCLEDRKVTEEMAPSYLLSLECSSYNHASFAEYPNLSVEKAVGNAPILNAQFSPAPPDHNCSTAKEFSTCSLAWEDLPFSETLTEFLCEENKDFDIQRHVNVQNHTDTTRNNLGIRLEDKNSSSESISACQSNTQIIDSHSGILLDITNTPVPNAGDTHDLCTQVCKKLTGCVNKSPARNICSQEDEKVSSLSFENEEEQLEGDTYNCSADLFGNSPVIDTNTNALGTHAETVRTSTEGCLVLSKPDRRHLSTENLLHSTPDKLTLKSNKCTNRDSLVPPGTQELDFIPPSQSTPIVKVAPASSHRTSTFSSQRDNQDAFYRNLPELDSKKITSSLCKSNRIGANQLCQSGRESAKENLAWSSTSSRHSSTFTPKRRFWKPNKHKNHLRVQREVLNRGSTGRFDHKCDSGDCEDSDAVVVPPTPAAKTGQSVKLRRGRQQSADSSRGDGLNCKRTLLDQTLKSSHRDQTQTVNCDSETVDEGTESARYLPDDENEACDWSRDLFSDSL